MKTFLTISFLFICKVVFAQAPAYRHYGVEDGLPSTLVYCATQDKNGFMWFGTDNGLARFDGNRFKVYGIEDGLPDPEVLNIFEDSQERLWISCFQKKPCYLKNGNIFNSENDSLANKIESKCAEHFFYEDKNNNIWITGSGAQKVCVFMDGQVECFIKSKDAAIGTSLPYVTEVDGKIYLYGHLDIFDITDPFNQKLIFKNESLYSSHPLYPSPLIKANQFNILHGNSLEIIDLNQNNKHKTVHIYNIPNRLNRIGLIESGIMWVYYPSSLDGVFKIDINNEEKKIPETNFFKGKKVSNFFKDREGNIWVTSLNDGIFVIHKNAPLIYDNKNTGNFISDNITAINLTQNNNLLFGDETGNLYSIAKGVLKQLPYQKTMALDRVRQIISLSPHSWVAIMNNAIYAEGDGSLIEKFKNHDPLTAPDHIGSPKYLFRHDDKTWIAHVRGIHYWTDEDYFPFKVILNKRFTAIGADSENNIWAGGIDGLLSQKDSFQINWGNKFENVSGRIIDIKNGGKNYLWVATAEYGLLRVYVSKGEIVSIEVINDILKNKINGIKSLFKSKDEKIWVPTNDGIFVLDDALNVRRFDMTDGLPSSDVNGVVVDQDTLWAATVAGLAKVQISQDKVERNFHTFFSGIHYELDGKTVDIDLVNTSDNSIKIPPGASMIDVQLSGLHFGGVTYEYVVKKKLLPLQWVTWGNLSSSLADKISPDTDTLIIKGHHRNFGAKTVAGCFETKVTAITKNGTASSMPDRLVISILPQWFETVWFSLLIIVVISLVFWRFYQQRSVMKRFERAASEMQLQAIKAQINPHFVGNSINAIQQFFYPPDPIRASQYIATFTSLLRQTMHLSEVPFIPFNQELGFITDYLEMVKLRFEDRFEYRISDTNEIASETPFPAMLLQPILENATLHGFAVEGVSRIEVEFAYKGKLLECSVQDNGVGIETSMERKKLKPRKRVSKGISLLMKKIEVLNKMHGVDINMEFKDLSNSDIKAQGTKVLLSFTPEKLPSFLPQPNTPQLTPF